MLLILNPVYNSTTILTIEESKLGFSYFEELYNNNKEF
jgi:hypothetical protein